MAALTDLEQRELRESLEEFFNEFDGSDVEWMFTSTARLRSAARIIGAEVGNADDDQA